MKKRCETGCAGHVRNPCVVIGDFASLLRGTKCTGKVCTACRTAAGSGMSLIATEVSSAFL